MGFLLLADFFVNNLNGFRFLLSTFFTIVSFDGDRASRFMYVYWESGIEIGLHF